MSGEDILFESTLKSNDNFKNTFIQLTSEKNFITIQNAIDDILFTEEEIIKLNNKIAQENNNRKIDTMLKKIDELKTEISLIFFKTQNLIISSYFNKQIANIVNVNDIEKYRQKLYNFKNLLGYTDGYTFFNDFYVSKMEELEKIYTLIENGTYKINTSLITKKQSKISIFLKTLIKILLGNKEEKKI